MAIEAGAVSGFLAGRVLGQYEFPVLEPERARAAAVRRARTSRTPPTTLEAPDDQLLRWVALHEMTHALQFGGVPWLREHLAAMLRELLGALEIDPRSLLRAAGRHDLRKLFERVREDGLAMVVVGRESADARPRAGVHGRPRGLRRARHGRRRRRRARRPAVAAQRARSAAAATAPAC